MGGMCDEGGCQSVRSSSAALAVPALAADLPVKAPAPPPPAYSWTGFGIGGQCRSRSWCSARNARISGIAQTFLHSTRTRSTFHLPIGLYSAASRLVIIGKLIPLWVVGVEAGLGFGRAPATVSADKQTSSTSAACIDSGDGFESIASRTDWKSEPLACARA